MKILSLFDGMACGMLAFIAAGEKVSRYICYEIDPYCKKTSFHNFSMIELKGDVFDADFTEYEGFDWLVGGSPCTYWSIAQTKNRETTASGLGWELFQQYVRALREANPKYFLYENNKSMSKAIKESITETFGFEPICINSALVSAQNRQRLYWVGIRQADGSYKKVNIEQPEDRGIMLKDILETSEGGWNPLSEKEMDYMVRDHLEHRWAHCNKPGEENKSKCIVANLTKGVPYNVVAEPIRVGTMPSPDGTMKGGQAMRVYSINGKSVTLKGQGGGSGAKTGLYAEPVCMRVKEATKQGYVDIVEGGVR